MKTQFKFFFYGFAFGLLFPVGALIIDGVLTYGHFSVFDISTYYRYNILHYIISSAPIILGAAFYYIGINIKRQHIENRKAELANARLRRINEELDTFNYHVSHDLQTVLNNTYALSKMLEKYMTPFNEDMSKDIIHRLQRQAKNGQDTVSRFLKIAQSSTTSFLEDIEVIDVKQRIEQIVQDYEFTHRVDLNFTNPSFSLQINDKAFESIFLNLITNAIKYSKQHPKVDIAFSYTKSEHIIQFSDQGIGIDLEKNGDRLFVPFKKIKHEHKVKQSNGVGLYLVKKIMINLGGKITVESTLGKGTHFFLHFPIKTNNEDLE